MSISLSHDTALLLRDLRKKIHKQPSAAKDAMEAGLSTYLLECLKSSEIDNVSLENVFSIAKCIAL